MYTCDIQADLAVVGRMPKATLAELQADLATVDFEARGEFYGFEPSLTDEKERQFAKQQGLLLQRIHAVGNFALFVNLPKGFERQRRFITEFMADFAVKLQDRAFEPPFCFSGYYAAMHDDRHIPCSHQIMLIAQNNKHRILSEPSGCLVCPEPGDILVLNTHTRHGLLPQKGLSAEKCKESPLKFFAMSFEPVQPKK